GEGGWGKMVGVVVGTRRRRQAAWRRHAATPRAARGIAEKNGSMSRSFEQTVLAFDVTLRMPTSQQGTAACCPPLKAGASLRRAGVFEETPHASGLAAGFFFRQRRAARAYSRRQLLANAAIAASRVAS